MNKCYRFDDHLEQIDTTEIEMQIAELEQHLPFEVEEPKLFAKRIMKQNKEGKKNKMLTTGKVIASVVCIAIVGTTGIYGAEMYRLYSSFAFSHKEGIIHIKSGDGNLSEAKAKHLSEEVAEQVAEGTWGLEERGLSNEIISIDEHYRSIQEVEEALSIEIIIPEYIPTECIEDREIKVRRTEGWNCKIDYVEMAYQSTTNPDKVLRVSSQYDQLGENVEVKQVTRGREIATYTNAKGEQYNVLEQDGGTLAQTVKGNMQYGLLFEGFSDTEMYEVIDSVDLSGN